MCSEHTPIVRKDKGVYSGLAELLWNCRYEEADRGTQQMAISQNPNVYMETMEEPENEGEEPAENGSGKRFGMAGRKQPERLLVYHANGSGKYGNEKRKTDKQWLL